MMDMDWITLPPDYRFDPERHEAARRAAVPVTEAEAAGDPTALQRAWSARVDSAFQGFDAIDPGITDFFQEVHGASNNAHLVEADLVAYYETLVEDHYATEQVDQAGDGS